VVTKKKRESRKASSGNNWGRNWSKKRVGNVRGKGGNEKGASFKGCVTGRVGKEFDRTNIRLQGRRRGPQRERGEELSKPCARWPGHPFIVTGGDSTRGT